MAGGEVRAGEKRAASRTSPASKPRGAFRPRSAPTATAPTPAIGGGRAHRARRDLDYVAIEDVGRAVNPHIVHGQAIGALVQGLGGVFLDQLLYDGDAQILNTSLADYLVPLACDFPNVRAITMSCGAQDQSARRQGCGRGRHGGGGDGRQCGGGARSSRRRGADCRCRPRICSGWSTAYARGGEFSG